MEKKPTRETDKYLLMQYSKNIEKAFMQSGVRISAHALTSAKWTTGIVSQYRTISYIPINALHLKELLEEKVGKSEISNLHDQLNSIQETIAKKFDYLANKMDELSEKVESIEKKEEKILVLRTLSREEAKNEILRLFKTGGVLDYGVIAEKLQLSLPLVVDICNELEEEDEIGEAS